VCRCVSDLRIKEESTFRPKIFVRESFEPDRVLVSEQVHWKGWLVGSVKVEMCASYMCMCFECVVLVFYGRIHVEVFYGRIHVEKFCKWHYGDSCSGIALNYHFML